MFLTLPKFTIIGMYQILFDLQPNMIFKAGSSQQNIDGHRTYRIKSSLFLNLCELYPKTKENLTKRALTHHKIFNYFKVENKKVAMEQNSIV